MKALLPWVAGEEAAWGGCPPGQVNPEPDQP